MTTPPRYERPAPDPTGATPAGSSEPTAPACYRHPQRETYIRCSRCDRPICPDCMRDAPVGFQCPECVRAGRPVRARTAVGARLAQHPSRVSMILIAINIVAFLLERADPGFEARFTQYNAAIAYQSEYYRLLTSTFLHVGWWHIALNMYALYLLGPMVERVLGGWRFLALYLASGVAGSVLAYLLTGPQSVSEGASGSIYGLFAAMWVLARRYGGETSQITGLILVNFALSFVIPRISWQGHLGGLIFGGVVALAYAYAPRSHRILVQVASLVGVVGFIVAATAARTAGLT